MLQRVVAMAGLVQLVAAHGYLKSPVSRNFGCKTGLNRNCGQVKYEPQSVEGPDRYPESGPPDGELAGAGAAAWKQLNAVGGWGRVEMQAGWQDLEWRFTAPHLTRDFRYYITRNGWAQDKPLARSSFEATPFCAVQLHGAKANTNGIHHCNVPHRTGYHVLLAVWDVADSAASFYNVADLQFGTSSPVATDAPSPVATDAPSPVATDAPSPVATDAPVPVVDTDAPDTATTAPATTQAPVVPPPTDAPAGDACAGVSDLVPAWGNCHTNVCCIAGWRCNRQSQLYSQCVPA